MTDCIRTTLPMLPMMRLHVSGYSQVLPFLTTRERESKTTLASIANSSFFNIHTVLGQALHIRIVLFLIVNIT